MDKVAKELIFSPIIRVVIPKGGCNGYEENEYAEIVAREKSALGVKRKSLIGFLKTTKTHSHLMRITTLNTMKRMK